MVMASKVALTLSLSPKWGRAERKVWPIAAARCQYAFWRIWRSPRNEGKEERAASLHIDKCYLTGYIHTVKIRSFVHKPLRRLYVEDVTKGLPPEAVDTLRKMLSFLQDMQNTETPRAFPTWKAHILTGSRKGTWSLHVTRNWRLAFRIEDDEIHDVNFEDYH